jgi:hypothetical protein
MKKLLFLVILTLLVGCSNAVNITYESKVTDTTTIALTKDSTTMFYYQGFVELDIKEAENISKIEVSNIRYEGEKIGIPTLHKGGMKFFEPADVKGIQGELNAGRKYDYIEFKKSDIAEKEGINTIKFHYIILNVPIDIPKDKISQNISMDMKVYNDKGKATDVKDVNIMIR